MILAKVTQPVFVWDTKPEIEWRIRETFDIEFHQIPAKIQQYQKFYW